MGPPQATRTLSSSLASAWISFWTVVELGIRRVSYWHTSPTVKYVLTLAPQFDQLIDVMDTSPLPPPMSLAVRSSPASMIFSLGLCVSSVLMLPLPSLPSAPPSAQRSPQPAF